MVCGTVRVTPPVLAVEPQMPGTLMAMAIAGCPTMPRREVARLNLLTQLDAEQSCTLKVQGLNGAF